MIRVVVTKDHILHGEQCEPFGCAIACALRGMGFIAPMCTGDWIRFLEVEDGKPAKRRRFKTPTVAAEFMEEFDDRGPSAQPIEFDLTEELP